jgi:hypothetical protein
MVFIQEQDTKPVRIVISYPNITSVARLQITPTITRMIGKRTGYNFLKNINRIIAETRMERPRNNTNSLDTN